MRGIGRKRDELTMTTARQIVTKALQKVGVLTISEQPDSEMANDALYQLNAMLSSWSNDSMLINVRAWETFNLVAGTALYTIGSGQTFNTTRPMFIIQAYARLNNQDYNVDVIDDENYNFIQDKSLTGIPYVMNYDNGYDVGKIRLYFVPDQAYQLFILSEKPLTSFALDDVVTLPPGWEDALIFNLAVRLSPDYGQEISATTNAMAKETKGAIRTAILRNRTMDAEPGVGVKPNIYNGWYYGYD